MTQKIKNSSETDLKPEVIRRYFFEQLSLFLWLYMIRINIIIEMNNLLDLFLLLHI